MKLSNTYYRLTKNNKLRVAYFGGSITYGTGSTNIDKTSWRALTGEHLKNKFPDAEITTLNASIGGTGTGYGIARIDNDLLKFDPDLVFIEFSINDGYQYYSVDDSVMFYESIINRIIGHNPFADIIMVFTTDRAIIKGDNMIFKAHRKLAEYYGFCSIDVGAALRAEINEVGGDLDDYLTDWVHPSDKGHKVYAKCVNAFFDKVLTDKNSTPIEEKNVLKTPLSDNIITTGFDNISVCDLDITNNTGFISEHNDWARNHTALTSYHKGDRLEFKFNGSYLGIWGDAWENEEASDNMVCFVDGVECRTVSFRSNCHSKMHVTCATNLEHKEHSVVLENRNEGKCTIDLMLIAK